MIIAIYIMVVCMFVEFYNITTWHLTWVGSIAMGSILMSFGIAVMIWSDIKTRIDNLESDVYKLSKKLSKIQNGGKDE